MAFTTAIWAGGAFAQSEPTVGDREKVTEGLWNKTVSEPQISQLDHQFPTVSQDPNTWEYVLIWQEQSIPGSGEFEAPWRLNYAVGNYVQDDGEEEGGLTWNVPTALGMPVPSGWSRGRNPMVTATHDAHVGEYRYIGGGSTLKSNEPDEITYTARSTQSEAEFGQSGTQAFTGAQTVHPRIGVFHRTFDTDVVHVLATNIDVNEGEDQQVFLRWSENSGASWSSPWEPVEADELPVIGYPSQPVLVTIGAQSDLHSIFAYANDDATLLATAVRNIENNTGGDFAGANFAINPNLQVGSGQTYYERSNQAIAGDFGIRPFVAGGAAGAGSKTVYFAWHDIVGQDDDDDEDFNIRLVRGTFTGSQWQWYGPITVNNDDNLGVQSDQFMHAIFVEQSGSERVHVAWYDTRHDLEDPDDDVKIALYYARVTFNTTTSEFGVEGNLLLDEEAIDTAYLLNPTFLGDRIDIAVTPDFEKAIVVYMGTDHPRGGTHTDPTDETIFSIIVNQNDDN